MVYSLFTQSVGMVYSLLTQSVGMVYSLFTQSVGMVYSLLIIIHNLYSGTHIRGYTIVLQTCCQLRVPVSSKKMGFNKCSVYINRQKRHGLFRLTSITVQSLLGMC